MKLKNVGIIVDNIEEAVRFYDPSGNRIEVRTMVNYN